MKKFAVAILAVLYLSTSVGATIHLHYCMGKFFSWSLVHNDKSKCSRCGMEKKDQQDNKGCCKDEYKLLKIVKDQRLSGNYLPLNQPISEFTQDIFSVYSFSFHNSLIEEYSKILDPPRSRSLSLLIVNCTFRI